MKFRIIEHHDGFYGETWYTVEKKELFWWFNIFPSDYYSNDYFDTIEEAEKALNFELDGAEINMKVVKEIEVK